MLRQVARHRRLTPYSTFQSGWLITAMLLVVLGTPFDSLAQRYQDPSFIIRNWTANDGLPVSGVSDLYQDEDGFLWLATLAGLARFDGARFRVFDTGSNPELPSNRITQFHSIEPGFNLLQTENSETLLFDGDSFLDLSAKFGFLRRSGTMSLGDGRAVLYGLRYPGSGSIR